MSGFRDLDLRHTYEPPDHPLDNFYVPVFSEAVDYTRMAGYFRSSALATAASGLARFIDGGGTVRLIVGTELTSSDVDAVLDGDALAKVVADRMESSPLQHVELFQEERLSVLAWLVKENRLQIKVVVKTDKAGKPVAPGKTLGYFHTKKGFLTDGAGDQLAMLGSANESRAGMVDNHESFVVFRSWEEVPWQLYGTDIVESCTAYWAGNPPEGWVVLDLPEAAREDLLQFAPIGSAPPPKEDPLEGYSEEEGVSDSEALELLAFIREAPKGKGGAGVGVATAVVDPFPHQLAITRRAIETFPRSYLLADEVGLGKTIEAGLILRELLVSGMIETALLLVPASVLRQWQQELYEQIGIVVPRLEGRTFRGLDDTVIEPEEPSDSIWNSFPVLLASSHLARRRKEREKVIAAGPWDVVLVDEAHHARRRGKRASDRNALLQLLWRMKEAESWKALYLATATPMQMHAYEAWDLLLLLGISGNWATSDKEFVRYFSELRKDYEDRDWSFISMMLRDYFEDPSARDDEALRKALLEEFGVESRVVRRIREDGLSETGALTLPKEVRPGMDRSLAAHTPMRDRVFRTTRSTLKRLKADGLALADTTIPHREVKDRFIEMSEDERRLYLRIETYISRYYDQMDRISSKEKRKALGFIMTVYRRRLTSSFEAVRRSLGRRLEVLEGKQQDLLDADDLLATEESLTNEEQDADDFATASIGLEDEIDELRSFLDELDQLPTMDSKMERLVNDINASLMTTHDSLLIFTQYTDTMDFIRNKLQTQFQDELGCYSGRGGEVWNSELGQWVVISKEDLKRRFRAGEIRVLIGTDSMSEGLNLQTSGRLINYDMPWNFMRVEQRIGRIDRIGGKPTVEISNYFYEDTVEEQIYRGIASNFSWFESVVGPAQPVLDQIEGAIDELTRQGPGAERDKALAEKVSEIQAEIEAAARRPLTLEDVDSEANELIDGFPPAELDLDLLNRICLRIDRNDEILRPNPEIPGTRKMTFQGDEVAVTFNKEVFQEHSSSVRILTYLTPEFNSLINQIAEASGEDNVGEVEVPDRERVEEILRGGE